MNLAHANIHAVCPVRANGLLRVSAANAGRVLSRKVGINRVSRLTARWHVAPETGKLECSWSLDATLGDEPAPSRFRRRRLGVGSSLSQRRSHRHSR